MGTEFWRRPEEKRPAGRTRSRWDANIKMGIQKWDGEAWSGLLWFRLGTGEGHL
jgi:hypothetical protein